MAFKIPNVHARPSPKTQEKYHILFLLNMHLYGYPQAFCGSLDPLERGTPRVYTQQPWVVI